MNTITVREIREYMFEHLQRVHESRPGQAHTEHRYIDGGNRCAICQLDERGHDLRQNKIRGL